MPMRQSRPEDFQLRAFRWAQPAPPLRERVAWWRGDAWSVQSWGLARTLDVEEGGFERVCGSGVETMVGGQKHDIRRPRSSGIKIIFLSSPSRALAPPLFIPRSPRVQPISFRPPTLPVPPDCEMAGDGRHVFCGATGFNWIRRR